MLKRSRKGLAVEITEERGAIFEGILGIVDKTLGTRYHEVYYQVYINPEKLSLEEMAERCYFAAHIDRRNRSGKSIHPKYTGISAKSTNKDQRKKGNRKLV